MFVKFRSFKEPYFNGKLILIVFLAIVIRTYFVVNTPVEWNPGKASLQAFNDEASHVNYVRYLMINKSLPVLKSNINDADAFIKNEFEYYQPPFSYAVTSLLAYIFKINPEGVALVYFCRSVAAVLGLLSILLMYFVLKNHFPINNALFFTLIYSLLPVHIRHTASFSNDVFLWIPTIVLLWLIEKKVNDNYKWNYLTIETVLLCLSLWIKVAILPLFAGYLFMSIVDKNFRSKWIIPPVVSLVLFTPYIIRNCLLYNQLLAMDNAASATKPFLITLSPYMIFKFIRGVVITYVFPYDTLSIPGYLKLAGYLLWVIIIVWVVYRYFKNLIKYQSKKEISNQYVFILFFLLPVLGLLYYNLYRFQPEYRMIFYNTPFLLLSLREELSNNLSGMKKLILFIAVLIPVVFVICYSAILG